MLSERSKEAWRVLVESMRADPTPFRGRDLLHHFVIGLHLRGESLYAHDLAGLVEEADLTTEAGEALVASVESSLALLEAYDGVLEEADRAYEDDTMEGGFIP